MFAKQKVAFVPQYPVHHMCAQSGRVTLVLVNNSLLRIDTQFPDNIIGMNNFKWPCHHGTQIFFSSAELDLNKYLSVGYKIRRLFVDPSGCHILVSAVHKDREKDPVREDSNAELIYVYATSTKPRQVFDAAKLCVEQFFFILY